MKQAVLESEVDSKLFYGFTSDELHKYFDAHKDKFIKPESIDLSEIFLSLGGKPEADVKARATELVKQSRGGADFCTLAAAYTERPATNGQKPCKIGLFAVPDLRPDIAGAVKNIKPGGVSDPLKTDEGYQILKVEARNAGNSAASFVENQVRGAITEERLPKEREDYLQGLRNDAYVKIADPKQKSKGKILGIIPKP
jgi:parvulin-like peptidyl-prolyl isomerase